MIPDFNEDGNLPEGIHEADWVEYRDRYGTSHHRKRQLSGLKEALESLRRAGCKKAYVDGSFVTSKNHPRIFSTSGFS